MAPELVRQSFESILKAAVQTHVIAIRTSFRELDSWERMSARGLTISQLRAIADRFLADKLHRSEIHPDAWPAIFIRDPQATQAALAAAAGDKYSYRDLDDFTDLIAPHPARRAPGGEGRSEGSSSRSRYISTIPRNVSLQYGMKPSNLKDILEARNSTIPGGALEVGPKSIQIDPSGKFENAQQIGDVIIGVSTSAANSPVYLRDLVDISRGYQSPPRYLNYLTWKDNDGRWHRSRAVTVAVQMKDGQQIERSGRAWMKSSRPFGVTCPMTWSS